MSEARKCDRCHGYFELSAEDQKNRDYPYYMKGAYVKIMLFGRYGEVENSVRWFDLCPNCMEVLNKWLENPGIDDDEDISEAAKFVETKSSEAEYKDPCKSCFSGTPCEQCDYGYCSEEDKKKRWLENHKDEVKLSDPYEEGGL